METPTLKQDKVVVISAPSGSGKTTIYNQLLIDFPILSKSISATTRSPRGTEQDGVEYHFMSEETFKEKIANDEFIEWEMVYEGRYYGTLKSEIERINAQGKIPILDIDVKGAQSIKNIYGDNAVSLFIKAPAEKIKERLIDRGTENEQQMKDRLNRLPFEFTFENKFDFVVENIDLAIAKQNAKRIVGNFLATN